MVQIGIFTTYDEVPEDVAEKARALGRALAERKCTVLTGGSGGLMNVISEAVVKAGGLTVGIMAREAEGIGTDNEWHNPYNTIRILTGQTFTMRSAMLVRSSDAAIAVAGGVGTLTEVSIAYNLGKPIIALKGTGMMAERLSSLFPDGHIDHRKLSRIRFVSDPVEAAELAFRLGKAHEGRGDVGGRSQPMLL
ncbi:MAG TPA: TIGR00725 family protein [Candidatus Methanomethylicus sp.]|nr:TIGR00725 family protein [Candidatus Methanomethylicus sp.]HRR53737.1 TIGR00725 family protein [Candidatus Methanomethylicus sp.]HRU81878.1 TIGR00725 family protein [Candidatus Methanomethylicus sp.]